MTPENILVFYEMRLNPRKKKRNKYVRTIGLKVGKICSMHKKAMKYPRTSKHDGMGRKY